MPAQLQGKAIVVVDDDPFIIEIIATYFSRLNSVFSYPSTELALRKIPDLGPINFFIIDYILPGLNGVKLFQELRPKHPKAKFVCISGNLTFELAEKIRQLGFHAMIVKPFDLEILDKNLVKLTEK